LRINEERIPKKILKSKLNRKCPKEGLRLGWEEQVREDIITCWGHA
jgi:hypothetical protein